MILVLEGRFSYMTKDNLGDRMKAYESVTNLKLIRRMPIVLRFDMCHGHTFTRGFQHFFAKPPTNFAQTLIKKR